MFSTLQVPTLLEAWESYVEARGALLREGAISTPPAQMTFDNATFATATIKYCIAILPWYFGEHSWLWEGSGSGSGAAGRSA